MKRSPIQRKKPMRRGKPRPPAPPRIPIPQLEHELFHKAAAYQRCCQSPDCDRPRANWQAHHVVYKQHLRKLGHPLMDTANSLRLCNRCHEMHHSRARVLKTRALGKGHLDFMVQLFGSPAGAADYLDRYYDPTDDPRVETLRGH